MHQVTAIFQEITFKFLRNAVAYSEGGKGKEATLSALRLVRDTLTQMFHFAKTAYWNPTIKRYHLAI